MYSQSLLLVIISCHIAGMAAMELYWTGSINPVKRNNYTLSPMKFFCKKDYSVMIAADLRPKSFVGLSLWSRILDRNLFSDESQVWGLLPKREREDVVKRHRPTLPLYAYFSAIGMSVLFLPLIVFMSVVIYYIGYYLFYFLTHDSMKQLVRKIIISTELLRRKAETESVELGLSQHPRKIQFSMPRIFRNHRYESVPEPLLWREPTVFDISEDDGFGSGYIIPRKRLAKAKIMPNTSEEYDLRVVDDAWAEFVRSRISDSQVAINMEFDDDD